MELKLKGTHERIERYEQEFRVSPKRYRTKVALAAALGYFVFFAALVVSAALLAACVVWHVRSGGNWAIYAGYGFFGFLIVSVLRSAFVRLPLPPGLEVDRKASPYLHEVVDSLRGPLKVGKRPIRILVDWNYNAYAFSRPAFGIAGPSTNYLGIGLPILASLNQEQTRAVIAHELVHFSRKHCRFGSRVGRMALMWTDLLVRLRHHPVTGFPFRAFVARYSKWFSDLRIVLVREDEFEADAVAAEVVGKEVAGQALMRIAVRDDLVVNQHWREIWQQSLVSDEVARQPITRLFRRLSNPMDNEAAAKELQWLLGEATEFWHDHPALGDRLRALGFEPPAPTVRPDAFVGRWSLVRPESTLKIFIGRNAGLQTFLDDLWSSVHAADWILAHHEAKPLIELMKEIDREWRENGRISAAKAWKRGQIAAAFYGEKEFLPIADYVLKVEPGHPHANFAKGYDLLRQFDDAGVAHVETAMERDPLEYREKGLALLSDYHRRKGDLSDYRATRYRAYSAADATAEAIEERSRPVKASEEFAPHGLNEEEIAELRESFIGADTVRRVYLVRREIECLPESTQFVIAVATRRGRAPFRYEQQARFADRILFPYDYTGVVLGPSRWRLRWKLSRIEGSLVLRKPLFGGLRAKKGKEGKPSDS